LLNTRKNITIFNSKEDFRFDPPHGEVDGMQDTSIPNLCYNRNKTANNTYNIKQEQSPTQFHNSMAWENAANLYRKNGRMDTAF